MKKLIFVHGDKGGVGKSTFARLLAQYYSTNQLAWHGFDADSTNGTLRRFYPDQTTWIQVRDESSIDQILNALEGEHTHLLVDLGARSGEIIQEWMQHTSFLQLRQQMGFDLTIAFVLSPALDSIGLLRECADWLGDQAYYVVVRNQIHGNNYALYEQSKAKCRLEELKAKDIVLPELLRSTYFKVDKSSLAWEVAKEDKRLELAERQRVKGFLTAGFAEIEKAKGYFV